jgi:hypothetical protein
MPVSICMPCRPWWLPEPILPSARDCPGPLIWDGCTACMGAPCIDPLLVAPATIGRCPLRCPNWSRPPWPPCTRACCLDTAMSEPLPRVDAATARHSSTQRQAPLTSAATQQNKQPKQLLECVRPQDNSSMSHPASRTIPVGVTQGAFAPGHPRCHRCAHPAQVVQRGPPLAHLRLSTALLHSPLAQSSP